MVKVKVTSPISPDEGYIFNKNLTKAITFKKKDGTVDVPKGTYDIYVEFYDNSYYYVFKEGVEVTDGMELEFSQDDSTHPIEFHYFDENNNELFMDITDKGKVETQGTADEVTKLFNYFLSRTGV